MPFNITSTLDSVLSYLQASAYFTAGAQLGEPKAPPEGNGLFAAVFMSSAAVAELTLGTTIERHDVTVRIYRNMLSDPTGDVETEVAIVVQKVLSDLAGDFDLGATIRAIDVGGMHGPPLATTWGYVDVGGIMFRSADIALGLIVDDSATLVA